MEDTLTDEQRILKQTYLREEILNAGYDAYSFKIFMESLKDDGANIDNWTFSELQKAVIEFRKKADLVKVGQELERIPSQEVSIQEKPRPATSQAEFRKIEGTDENIEQLPEEETKQAWPFRPSIDKKKENSKNNEDLEATELLTKKQKPFTEGPLPTDITIMKTELQKGGLFGMGRSHIVYIVRSEPCGWEVKRRFSDFSWLRSTLAKLYPGFLVPMMTKKKAGKGKLDYYTLKKKAFLTAFLRNLIKTPEFINNEYTIAFLRMSDKKKFEAKRKEAENQRPPSRIEEHVSLEGKAELQISEENKQFSHYMAEYFDATSPVYSMLKKKTKKLLMDLDLISTDIFEIAKNFDDLFKLSLETAPKILDGKTLDPMKDIYVSMNNMMVSWGNTLVKQANFLQERLFYFLKYQGKQVSSFQELIKTRTSAEQEHKKFKLRLETKKDKLWLASDPSKWELASNLKVKPSDLLKNKIEAYKQMCHKENLMENDLKNLFGYYSSQVLKEVPKGLDLIAYNYRKLMEGMTEETEANFQEMLRDWGANRDFLLQDATGRPGLIKGSSIMMKMDRTNNCEVGVDIDTVTERRDSDSD